MVFDPSRIQNVRKETKEQLLRWKSDSKPSSPQHIAANVELVRRDDQVKAWFWAAVTIGGCRCSLLLSFGSGEHTGVRQALSSWNL